MHAGQSRFEPSIPASQHTLACSAGLTNHFAYHYLLITLIPYSNDEGAEITQLE